jgi:multiple sugar transport system ATP-binding protein
VTHDQHEAIALSHRIAVMRAGKLEQLGAYRHLYESPVNLFVATFIGTPPINLFDGRVDHSHWYGKNFGNYGIRSDLDDNTNVVMGIRPEHLKLAEEGIPCRVEEVTPFLPERQQLVEVEANRERWAILLPLEPKVRKGETLRCTPDKEQILYFDKQSSTRIG